MATDAETGTQVDAADVWRAIGRMEGDVAALKDGQQEANRRLEAGLSEANRSIDRVFYTILAVGGALLVAVFAARLLEG